MLSTVLALAFATTPSAATIVGYAYDRDDKALQFTESYQQTWRDNSLIHSQVIYRSPDQNLLATKELNYIQHPYVPEFSFTNHVTGYAESVHWLNQNQVNVRHKNPGTGWQDRILEIEGTTVADAGFDKFIQDHLTLLQQGQDLQFNFISPARLDWFRFRAKIVEKDADTVKLEIAPRNLLLKVLVEPIYLTYQIPGQTGDRPRLLHYSGLTNMSINGTDTVVANIFYRYSDRLNRQVVYRF